MSGKQYKYCMLKEREHINYEVFCQKVTKKKFNSNRQQLQGNLLSLRAEAQRKASSWCLGEHLKKSSPSCCAPLSRLYLQVGSRMPPAILGMEISYHRVRDCLIPCLFLSPSSHQPELGHMPLPRLTPGEGVGFL